MGIKELQIQFKEYDKRFENWFVVFLISLILLVYSSFFPMMETPVILLELFSLSNMLYYSKRSNAIIKEIENYIFEMKKGYFGYDS